MTIALGILAQDGIVLAADAQVTAGIYKRNEGKVSMALRWDTLDGVAAHLIVTGAGTSSSVEHIRQGLTKSFNESPALLSVPEIRGELETQILDFHNTHVTPHGGGMLDVWMIAGAVVGNERGLWVSDKSFVNHASMFAAVGIGEAHASSLMGRLFAPMSMIGAMLLAAFIIYEVKQTIEGCGNDTDIVGIGRDKAYWIDRRDVKKLEDIFNRYARVNANRVYELFCDNIGWSGWDKSKTETEAELLRCEVRNIIASFENVPDWAKDQPSSPTNSESSQAERT